MTTTQEEDQEYDEIEEPWREILKDASLKFTKGFISGTGLYAGVKGITALMRNPFRKR